MNEEFRDCSWLTDLLTCQVHSRVERRDARENRQQILEAARRLFAMHGVDAISMHQIARAAGIGQGTLYRRYRHKGELCRDLLQDRYQTFLEELATFFSAARARPVLDQLQGLLERIIFLLEEQGTLLGPIALRECQTSWEEVGLSCQLSARPSFFSWLHELFAGLFTEAVARGELSPFDIPYTTDTLVMNLYPPFYRVQRQERGFSPERILQGLCHMYIDGLRCVQVADSRECRPRQDALPGE